MVSKLNFGALIALVICLQLFVSVAWSEEKKAGDIENLEYEYKPFNSIIYAQIGFSMASESKEFFDKYGELLGGFKTSFNKNPALGAGVKFQFSENFRYCVEFEYLKFKLMDNYSLEIAELDEKWIRSFSQRITIEDYPVLVSLEYMPINQQFRTYVGAGAGVLISSTVWNESVDSNIPRDSRKGGKHYDEVNYFPSFRFYVGTALGFDKIDAKSLFGGLTVELKYNYSLREFDIFHEISEQMEELDKRKNFKQELTILPGYIGLYIGATLNLSQLSEQ